MRAGSFDRVVTVERQFETSEEDVFGSPILEWRPVHRFWAGKIHKAEDEAFAASQRYAKRTVTFSSYWLEDIKETDRLICDGVQYDIRGLREIGFREGIEISAEWRDGI